MNLSLSFKFLSLPLFHHLPAIHRDTELFQTSLFFHLFHEDWPDFRLSVMKTSLRCRRTSATVRGVSTTEPSRRFPSLLATSYPNFSSSNRSLYIVKIVNKLCRSNESDLYLLTWYLAYPMAIARTRNNHVECKSSGFRLLLNFLRLVYHMYIYICSTVNIAI